MSDSAFPAQAEVIELDPSSSRDGAFDFESHGQRAAEKYQPLIETYAAFAQAVYAILRTCVDNQDIKVHSIEHRAKKLDSFAAKAALADPDNPAKPKYSQPMEEITDLAGVRVITYFRSTEDRIDPILGSEFDILEVTDKSALLEKEERLGYHSVHYLVTLKRNRCTLPEYARFDGLVAEVQVRTILQHSWAEIEHDIQYKAVATLPAEIRRRFMTLAGLLEIADREFQDLEDENLKLRDAARKSVAAGRLEEVEITPDAVKSYLDKAYGPDGRMSDYSYVWEARLLRRLGFSDMQQVDKAVSHYDDDELSRILYGTRQGQLTRFDYVLLAAMGEEFVRRHPFTNSAAGGGAWWHKMNNEQLEKFRAAGIEIGTYIPRNENTTQPS